MKKRLIMCLMLVCVLALTFGLAACGGANGDDNNNDDATPKSLSFELIDNDTAYSVSAGTVDGGAVVIPAEHEGKPVMTIAANAFYGIGITSVTIPNGVISIEEQAFMYCGSLESVTIANSVTSIGDSAFRSCLSLVSITIPNSVTSIGTEAFYECSALENITMPDSVKSLGLGSLNDTKWLNNQTDDLIYIGNILYLASYATNVMSINANIREGTVAIACGAFRYCEYRLKSVTIPNSVTSIGSIAFRDSTGLTSIIIPGSVTYMGENAFSVLSAGNLQVQIKVREFTSAPEGWHANWNPLNRPVTWNYTGV